MDQFTKDANRDTILFVNEIIAQQLDFVIQGVKTCEERLQRKLNVLIVTDKRDKHVQKHKLPDNFKVVTCNTDSVIQLEETLLPYLDKLVAVVCRGERNIPYFKKIIPHVPYLRTPTAESLEWSTNKLQMRRRLTAFNKNITPKYAVVTGGTSNAFEKLSKKVGFPLVVKPTGLAASVLVTISYHEDELKQVLNKVFTKLTRAFKRRGYEKDEPVLVAEEFMDGIMYTTDIYVNSRGIMHTTPLIHVQTGHALGREDFYGYKQITPVKLKEVDRSAAYETAKEAVRALALRSITAHVELMWTTIGWKVIEVGPRVGGFRDFLYSKSYGFDHAANDILTRIPLRPTVSRRALGHSAVMKLYAEQEGVITSLTGITKAKEFESVEKIDVRYKKGDQAIFARHGGVSVADVYFFNKDRSKLLADMRRV